MKRLKSFSFRIFFVCLFVILSFVAAFAREAYMKRADLSIEYGIVTEYKIGEVSNDIIRSKKIAPQDAAQLLTDLCISDVNWSKANDIYKIAGFIYKIQINDKQVFSLSDMDGKVYCELSSTGKYSHGAVLPISMDNARALLDNCFEQYMSAE